MKEYLNAKDNFKYVQDTSKRFEYYVEIPEGAEVLTGLKTDRFSWVFWKPSVGEVWQDGRFAKYVIQKSMSFEEYIDSWTSDPVLWRRSDMKEQYVIKTRNDFVDEYMCLLEHRQEFEFIQQLSGLQCAYKFSSLDAAREALTQQCVIDSKYKCDIYKVVQALEFVERGV